YLKRFSLDALKIDRTLISGLTNNSDNAVIVEAAISLAHKLGLEVTAEGVETDRQLEFLRTHTCDLMQGDYFSQSLPMPEFIKLLHEKKANKPELAHL